jgi:hypothetical protein
MQEPPSSLPERNFFNLVGWLFADLLLVLAVTFLVASTVGALPPPSEPTPTPLGQLPTCTPAPTATQTQPAVPGLETDPVTITLNLDVFSLLNGNPNQLRAIDDQVRAQTPAIAGRKVGVALTLASGPDAGQDTDIAKAVNQELARLGTQEHYLFDRAVFRPLINLGSNIGTVTIDMFLFAMPPVAATPTPLFPTNCRLETPTP